jgi:TonB family protein
MSRWFGPLVLALLTAALDASAQAPSMPVPSGRTLEASDGDIVVVPGGARVTVVRRTQVQARLIHVAAQQTVLLLTDPPFSMGEGLADMKGFHHWQVRDPWPLGARWEGSATIDEYLPGPRTPMGIAIHTDRGTIVLGHVNDRELGLSPPPLAVVRIGSMGMRMARGTFDEIEQAWLAGSDDALGDPTGRVQMSSGGMGMVVSESIASAPGGAVRVGGNIAPPTRTHLVDPVYPETARASGVQGVVILEAVIGPDGAVSNARVLRSIPPLDAAAVDAVRQWRYTPTLVNGVPTPVIMTVTVNFHLPPNTP